MVSATFLPSGMVVGYFFFSLHFSMLRCPRQVCWSAFSSASAGVESSFGGALFRIHCGRDPETESVGYFPASIEKWSYFPTEKEVLIPPHYMLRVNNLTDDAEDPDQWVVELELADGPPMWQLIQDKDWKAFESRARQDPGLVNCSSV